ncbi:MAG: ABC transporter substrate-binding protein/permease [Candidatus Sericytochromatia bacterium]
MYKSKYFLGTLLATTLSLLSCLSPAFSAEDALDRIKKEGVLKWGADAESGAPYEFYNPANPTELIGFEIDIMTKIAAKIGVKHEMVQNEWDALVPGLKRGNFDLAMAGIEVTDLRRREINFSRPYYVYSEQIAVRKDNDNIFKLEDLKGKAVGTQSGTVAMRMLKDLGGVDTRIYSSIVGSYKDLENGRTDAVLLDLPIAVYYAKPNPALKFTGDPIGKGYYGIGVRKEDEKLLKKVNEVLEEMLKNGELEKIYKKWNIWTPQQKELSNFEHVDNPYYKKEDVTSKNTTNSDSSATTGGPVKKTMNDRLTKDLPLLLKGALITIEISIISMILAIMLGLSLAIIRIYAPAPLQMVAATYVEIFRGTPLLIQLYLIYYGLPELGIKLNAFTAAILGLCLNYAAYEAENYRAGIKSIPKGQMEAATALGMSKFMALRRIIIPQAIKVVIPPVTNDFIALFKDSSIVSVITMVELTKQYNYLASVSYDYIGLGLMTATLYFLMSYPASVFARKIERKLQT